MREFVTKPDYYDILGVPRGADQAAIRQAYRALARRLHPDVSDAPEAAARFSELAEAYGVLSRPLAKRLYDHLGYRGSGGFAQRREPDVSVVGTVEVGFLDAERGAVRPLRLEAETTCRACGGGGAADGSVPPRCPRCEGSGRIRILEDNGSVRLLRIYECDDCAGRGRLIAQPCATCGGAGVVRGEHVASVSIPRGARDGQRIPVSVAGAGEIFALLRVQPRPQDARLVRYAALAGLVLALVLLVLVLSSRS